MKDKNLEKDIIALFENVLNNTFTSTQDKNYKIFETRSQNSKGLKMIAMRYTNETYQVFKKILLKERKQLAFIQLYLKEWLVPVYITYIEKDLKNLSSKQLKNILYLGPDGLGSLNSLTQHAIIRKYEYNEEVSDIIVNRVCFHNEVWKGSTVDHYKRKLEEFSKWAKSHHLEKNKIVIKITNIFQDMIDRYTKAEEDEKFLSRNDDT